MKIGLLTLFPEMFAAITNYGVSGRALERQLLQTRCFNPRDFTSDRHQTVDDRPYGGGPGMVMLLAPLRAALHAAQSWCDEPERPAKVIYLSPQGQVFKQASAEKLSNSAGNLILIAGRYEGIDERFIQRYVDEEWSIGDYVLSGGELAAMVMIDSITRLLPGALGHEASAREDSFSSGLLDCPHYTRPVVDEEGEVPDVLLSGNHERIRRWRLQQALARTYERRPELLEKIELDSEQKQLLAEYRSLSGEQIHKTDSDS